MVEPDEGQYTLGVARYTLPTLDRQGKRVALRLTFLNSGSRLLPPNVVKERGPGVHSMNSERPGEKKRNLDPFFDDPSFSKNGQFFSRGRCRTVRRQSKHRFY